MTNGESGVLFRIHPNSSRAKNFSSITPPRPVVWRKRRCSGGNAHRDATRKTVFTGAPAVRADADTKILMTSAACRKISITEAIVQPCQASEPDHGPREQRGWQRFASVSTFDPHGAVSKARYKGFESPGRNVSSTPRGSFFSRNY